ncbi:MAG: hypothetical protein IJ374_11735 [Lachnospiraceae bacterium]|nr:hypothetical protein [Lachnospiraceae bacterium]
MRKRIYAVLVSLLLTLFCCGFAASNDGPPVAMEVSSILGEMGKMGAHIPVSVSLYGQNTETFEGTLVVRTLENAAEEGAEVYEYQHPVEIGCGETELLELYIPLGQRSSEIYVVLLNSDGEEIGAETMFFDVSKDMGRLLIGALTEKEEEISFLGGVSLDYGMVETELISLNEDRFPKDARGLEILDVVVINHYETDRLSDEQIEALKAWVEDGGTLLIGTGAMAESTLGPLAEDLVELPIGGVFYENVNLGAEYAEKAPGDSDVNMACVDLVIPDGVVVEESDRVPLLTVAERGEGRVGIYSYDLSEITNFVGRNPSYVNKMLTDVLDEDEISNLYYYSSYESDEDYWNAYSLVNTGSAERLPNLVGYTVVIVVYILVAGPGLYLFLKKKDMSRLYSSSVVFVSVGMAAVIYLMGTGTRFTSQFFTVASVVEMDGKTVTETSYMNVRTPDSRPFSVTIPAEYAVTPLTRTSRYDEQPVMDFSREENGSVELQFSENGTVISARKTKAFEPRFFKLSRENENLSALGISGNVQWNDGMISGSIANHLPFALENAVLMLYGQMYSIGNLEAGKVLELQEEPLLVWPAGMAYMVAGQITGSDNAEEESQSEYLRSSEKSNLLSYYIGERFSGYHEDAYLVGIGPTGGVLSEESLKDQTLDGTVLYAAKIPVSSGSEDLIYRSGLKHKPEVNSGSGAIYSDGLSMYGTEPLAVEYFLGTDITVEKLSFLPVSDVFTDDPSYYYLKRFDGVVHFYNYTTQTYDRVNLSQVDFGVEELRPYLSQTGSIVVKYTGNEGDSMGVTSLLPHLMVTGRAN